MDDTWFNQLKWQIEELRDRKILKEEKNFCRIENYLVRSIIGFTDIFLDKMNLTLNERVPILLRKMRNMLLLTFRRAIDVSVCEEDLNLPRFLISLQEHLRIQQKRFELSNYKLLHSFALETGSNSLIHVKCCFVVDLDVPEPSPQRLPLFDFSISGFENIKGRIFDPNGREIVDILDPKLTNSNWFSLPNLQYALSTG